MHSRGAERRRPLQAARAARPGPAPERRNHDERRRNGFISHLQLFATIPYQAVETVLADCPTREVSAGAVLLEPGQGNDSIHLLVCGRLRIHHDRADSADYIPIEEGSCFGELSIIDGRPVSAYVVADRPSRVLTIHESVFWERLIPHPGVARNLLGVLSERMRLNGEIILERIKDKLALDLLQKELAIAHHIQLSMLPPGSRLFPGCAEAQAFATMEPAKDVGGDFYDAFVASPGRLFVAVGDVSGKGVPAALFMARTITQMRMEAIRTRSPAAVLEAVNRALCEGNDAGMFVTLFCGSLDTATGQFTFANAGHNPPVLVGTDGGRHYLKVKKGLVAGIMENARYRMDTLTLAPGQSVLLYTDGVTEAIDPGGGFYSEERLLGTLGGGGWDDPRVLVDAIRADIADFAQNAPQADDITMLALRYSGGPAAAPRTPELRQEKSLDSFRQVSRDVTSGAVTSVISLVYSLSFAALIFSGDLAGGFPQGISALLIGTGVTALAVAMLSVFRFAVSGPDGNACAVMAGMGAAIARDLSVDAAPGAAVSNVLYMLALGTLITGFFLAALGAARAGRWIRFVPYPVVGGLIAAAGALTILGAARMIGGVPVTPETISALADPLLQHQFLAGAAWAALLVVVLPRMKSAFALPLVQIGGLIAFHAALIAFGLSIEEARSQGWLFAAPADTAPWTPWNATALAQTEWSLFLGRAGDIGALALVTTLTVLINATGLEMETRTDANLDRELLVQGGANIAVPLLGGFLGYLSMNRSLMNFRLGGTNRASGVAFALAAVVFAWTGVGLIGYLPRAVLGGLLLYFGIMLLRKWAVVSRLHLPLPEYLTLLLILAVTVLSGFGYGLIVGVLAGCVMFAVTCSKVRVVKFSFTGREFRSSHERSAEDKALLTLHGEDIRIFVLQGFIFFGMADRLYRSVIESAFPAAGHKARLVVLDLNLVHGVDASAIASFKKISYGTRAAGARLVITGMRPEQVADWQQGGDADLLAIRHFADLDSGAEWCEAEVLAACRDVQSGSGGLIGDWLRAEVGDSAGTLIGCMERRTLVRGEILCRQDQPADEMYFIESGRVAIELEVAGSAVRRLRTLGPKTVLGEMGLYRSARRSANVVVQEASVVYVLTVAAMRGIESAHPQAAARFHAMVVRTVADRLEFSNALVAALQR